jgi:hypothetical protein
MEDLGCDWSGRKLAMEDTGIGEKVTVRYAVRVEDDTAHTDVSRRNVAARSAA